jgi:ABC-type nitrate/sulfonate/bicarbonate transport system substrate-binding protein
MLRTLFSFWLLFLLFLHAVPCQAQEKIKLRVSSATKTLGYGPLWIVSNRGFFARQGLDVDLSGIRASDVGIQTLAREILAKMNHYPKHAFSRARISRSSECLRAMNS